jgi:hypothetical protein
MTRVNLAVTPEVSLDGSGLPSTMPSRSIASTIMSEDPPHITSGPRYDWMLEAINFSVATLRRPLSVDDREYGWTTGAESMFSPHTNVPCMS